MCHKEVLLPILKLLEAGMKQVCRIGLDIAKNKFQVHGVDKHEQDAFNKQLNRNNVLEARISSRYSQYGQIPNT